MLLSTGTMRDGRMTGTGHYVAGNGSIYEGQFHSDYRHGQGELGELYAMGEI